jgi:4-amino-4-deoxy-L-arabinose transferase-like glycosyltransferase
VAAAGVYAIGWAAGGRTAALAAGLVFALLPGQIVFASLTMSEVLSTATLVFVVLAALRWSPARHGAVTALALGAGVGLAAYVRGQALVLLPALGLFWWLAGAGWKQALAWGTLATFGALAALAPWTARNARELGSPIVVSSNLGGNLWMGHHEGATGGMDPHLYERSFDHLPPERREAARSEAMLRDGVRFLLTHPREELALSLNKIRLVWESDSVGLDWNEGYGLTPIFSSERGAAIRSLTNAMYYVTLAIGAAGLAVGTARRNPAATLLALVAAAWTAAHVLFFGDPRFHIPVMFALCVGAGVMASAAAELSRRLSGRGRRPLLAGAS